MAKMNPAFAAAIQRRLGKSKGGPPAKGGNPFAKGGKQVGPPDNELKEAPPQGAVARFVKKSGGR